MVDQPENNNHQQLQAYSASPYQETYLNHQSNMINRGHVIMLVHCFFLACVTYHLDTKRGEAGPYTSALWKKVGFISVYPINPIICPWYLNMIHNCSPMKKLLMFTICWAFPSPIKWALLKLLDLVAPKSLGHHEDATWCKFRSGNTMGGCIWF